VANYRTTLLFDEVDDRVKAGMTADIDIVTDERSLVISIPQRSVIFKDDRKIVRVLEGGELVERDVETGISGERGMIEIVSGVSEGEEIVTSINR
jgi:multidrug efflux pump subunit AcrA (membrane-fusion protein)